MTKQLDSSDEKTQTLLILELLNVNCLKRIAYY